MTEQPLRFVVEAVDAGSLADDLRAMGADVVDETRRSALPSTETLLVVVSGAALLAEVVNRIVHSWRDKHGTLIDARGVGDPRVRSLPSAPFGTVVVLSGDDDRVERSDLPPSTVGEYIAKALGALVTSAGESDRSTSA